MSSNRKADDIEEIDAADLGVKVNPRMMEQRKSVVDVIREKVSNWPTPMEILTGLPGLSDISAVPEMGAKLFWVVFTLFAVSMTGYQLYEVIANYIKTPTSITMDFQNVPFSRFPPFMICPLAATNYTYVAEKNFSMDYVRWVLGGGMSNAIPDSIISAYYMSQERKDAANAIYEDISRREGLTWLQQFHRLMFQCDQYVVHCELNTRPFDCCKYVEERLASNGKCFMIRAGEDKKLSMTTTETGPIGALEITLDMQTELTLESLIISKSRGILSPTYQLGAGISFSEPPLREMEEYFTFVPPEYIAYIALEHKQITSFPGSSCRNDRTLAHPEGFDYQFSRIACEFECFYNESVRVCGCGSHMTIPNIPGNCDLKKQYECLIPYLYTAKAIEIQPDTGMSFLNHSVSCNVDCKTRCFKEHWIPSTTYAELQTKDKQLGGRKLSKVVAYYPLTSVTVVEEINNLEWSSMVGQLGGVLGLWLGASIASIVQVLFYTCVKLSQACGVNKSIGKLGGVFPAK